MCDRSETTRLLFAPIQTKWSVIITIEQENLYQQSEHQLEDQQPVKPDNNLVMAIVCTVCCCLPFGIVGIVKACRVNSLWLAKQYDAAILEAQSARKWSLIGIVCGVVISIIYVILYGAALANQ